MADTSTGFFKALKMLHNALLMGMIVFLGVSFFVIRTQAVSSADFKEYDRILQVVAVLVSLIAVVIGFRNFKNALLEARNSPDPALSRADKYRTACIIWWALIEGPGIFAIICFVLTGNYSFFALGCFHVVALAVFMPRKENIIVLLNLNQQEVSELEGN